MSSAGRCRCAAWAPARYRVRDYFNDRDLGEVAGPHNSLPLAFHGALLLEAIPV